MTEDYAAGKRLLSAVIGMAINDACMPAFEDAKRESFKLHSEAEDALEFLFYSPDCDRYLMVMDIDPTTFRRCLVEAMHRSKLFDITGAKLRHLRLNYRLFIKARESNG